jgi:hypothetical protein
MLSAAVVACASLASASSAFATEGFTSWVGIGTSPVTTEWTGELTLKLNGENPKTCTGTFSVSVQNSTASGGIGSIPSGSFSDKCTGGTSFTGHFLGFPTFNTKTSSYELHLAPLNSGMYTSPYGTYTTEATEWWVGWTNGSGEIPSHVVFNNTYIGATAGPAAITATGTLNATKQKGGLLTLTH